MSQNGKGYMEDSRGRLVPIDLVSEIDQLRDQTVRGMIERAEAMRDELRKFREEMMDDVATFVSLSASEYGVEYGGTKGNICLTSYDGTKKVSINIHDQIVFDERLQVAKQLVDECISEWTEGARSEIKALIQDAFKVDTAGRVDRWRVLGLRSLQIDDEKWLRAMKAIGESIQIVGKQEYLRFHTREKASDKWQIVNIDLATA